MYGGVFRRKNIGSVPLRTGFGKRKKVAARLGGSEETPGGENTKLVRL